MKRILADYLTERIPKADRSWLPSEKMFNSFSHPPKSTDNRQHDIFYKGHINHNIDRSKIIL